MIMNEQAATDNIFNHITFYKDDSLQITCGMKDANHQIVVSLAPPTAAVGICDHNCW